jgi:hypothetical protein
VTTKLVQSKLRKVQAVERFRELSARGFKLSARTTGGACAGAGGTARRTGPDSYEGSELTVGTDVPLVQRAAGRGGQAHRECGQIGLVVAPGVGEVEETAAGLHAMAAGTYPFLKKLKPADSPGFSRWPRSRSARRCCCLSSRPLSRARGVGHSPAACSACTPGRPACAGYAAPSRASRGPLAKDVWMVGIGLGLVIDGLTDR